MANENTSSIKIMPPDFNREVHCLLGLPFDAVNMPSAVRRIRASAADRSPCFLSTPNLNFLIAAQSDAAFRNSVINSHLSIADGMPLIWIARLLGIPIRERVAGSALFDALRLDTGKPLSVFFFGGPDGAAEAACRQLNLKKRGLTCAGFESPGFGTIEEMSDDGIIQRINASNADFLVVSLGAKKGQAWIERNRGRITVPVISHLGAVVNFVAGTVLRAPVWMQNTGLEWLWRIKEDPALWRRYFWDGLALLKLLAVRVLPYVWFLLRHKPVDGQLTAGVETTEDEENFIIHLRGVWTLQNIQTLRDCFIKAARAEKDVRLEMSGVTYVDSAFVGLVMLLQGHQSQSLGQLKIEHMPARVRRIFKYCCSESLC
ncbi:MAG: WecB/TagA/CpsF family glycosyltransferase [Sideroxyarcus sp.]|nr:WecB/TagA/CpsF family glycosyltransferase [Sideroxyarcus sp.]